MKSGEEQAHAALLAQAMKAIRKERRLRASEVARALGMPLRTYEHFEAGRGRMTYDRLVKFAEVTDSDPVALLATLPLLSPEFAVRCADNKLMTILMMAVSDLDDDLGEDLTYLDPATLIHAFSRLKRDLAAHVRGRDMFAETWYKERSKRVQGATPVLTTLWRKRTT